MSTGMTIFIAVALKGALVVILRKFGWWPDWEVRDREVREEKALLRAYKKWRKDAGPEAAAELRVACDRFTGGSDSFWPIKKRRNGGPLAGSGPTGGE